MPNMSTGSQIKKYRKKLRWTLDRLSEASGVDGGTISALENRNSKRSEKFGAIAKAFGLTIEQLCDENTDHDPKPPPMIYGTHAGTVTLTAKAFGSEIPLGWPFSQRVAPWQYHQLDDAAKTQIEDFIIFKLQGQAPPAEQHMPANNGRTGT